MSLKRWKMRILRLNALNKDTNANVMAKHLSSHILSFANTVKGMCRHSTLNL